MTPNFRMFLVGFALFAAVAAAVIFSMPADAAEPYDHDTQLMREKPTEPVIVVSLDADHTMTAALAKVPRITDGKALLCFKDPDKQTVSCFVLNVKTGQVVFVELPTDIVTL